MTSKLCILFAALALACVAAAKETRGSPQTPHASKSGEYMINGKAYYINNDTPLPWFQAIEACNARGMALVGLETTEEMDAIVAFIRDDLQIPGTDFWTSLHYFSSTWIWTNSGTTLNSTAAAWIVAEGEPNDYSTEVCVGTTLHRDHWHDEPCTAATWHYICE